MRFSIILITVLTININLIGSNLAQSDTIIINSDKSIERINANLDSLAFSWYVKLALKNAPNDFQADSLGIAIS